jgi:hypothetical protein
MNFSDFNCSRSMIDLIEEIRDAVTEGINTNAIQSVPHFVLLRRSFYTSRLLNPLTRWVVMWAMAKGITGMTEDQCFGYIISGTTGNGGAVGADLSIAVSQLSPEYVKLLNLCHIWVTSLLPHILSKIHCVSFGLLSPEELTRQTTLNPTMPKVNFSIKFFLESFFLFFRHVDCCLSLMLEKVPFMN